MKRGWIAALGLAGVLAGCGETAATSKPAAVVVAANTPEAVATAPPAPTPVPKPPEASFKASAQTLSYPALVKDPAAIKYTVVTGEAKVAQYDSVTGNDRFLADYTHSDYDFWSDSVIFDVRPADAAHVCKDTVIRYWAGIIGPYTYTNTLGGQNTVPELAAEYVDVVSGGC